MEELYEPIEVSNKEKERIAKANCEKLLRNIQFNIGHLKTDIVKNIITDNILSFYFKEMNVKIDLVIITGIINITADYGGSIYRIYMQKCKFEEAKRSEIALKKFICEMQGYLDNNKFEIFKAIYNYHKEEIADQENRLIEMREDFEGFKKLFPKESLFI
jgi:hypothetical protein